MEALQQDAQELTKTARKAEPGPTVPTRLRRPSINITPVERAERVAIGSTGTIAGLILLVSTGSDIAIALVVLLIVASLDLIVTGALGHCPLYRKLGYIPSSLRGRQ